MENRAFVMIAFTLVLLIALALWQFYSLAWADVVGSSHSISILTPSTAVR
jgi:hypothetical protein